MPKSMVDQKNLPRLSKSTAARESKIIPMERTRKFFVGANWKSNGSMEFSRQFTNNVLNKLEFDPTKVDVVIAPTSLHVLAIKALANENVQVAC